MKAQLSSADLLRALSQTSTATELGVARALNWQMKHNDDNGGEKKIRAPSPSTESTKRKPESLTNDTFTASLPPLYWYVSDWQRQADQADTNQEQSPSYLLNDPDRKVIKSQHQHWPLLSAGDWQNLWDKLPLLSGTSTRLDLPASVKQISRGHPIARLPYLKTQCFNRPVCLIMDTGSQSEPIEVDLYLGKKSLQLLLGDKLQAFSLLNGPNGRWLLLDSQRRASLDATSALAKVDPQALVILMGGLGATKTGIPHTDWQALMAQMVEKRQPYLLMNAVPVYLQSQPRYKAVDILPLSLSLSPARYTHEKALTQLLAVLSQVRWPSLSRLRALRLALPDASLTTELQIMQHPSVIFDFGKLNLKPRYHKYYSAQFNSLPVETKRSIQQVIDQGRNQLSRSLRTMERFYADLFSTGIGNAEEYDDLFGLATRVGGSLSDGSTVARAQFCSFLPTLNQASQIKLDASWAPLLEITQKIANSLDLPAPQQSSLTQQTPTYVLAQYGNSLNLVKSQVKAERDSEFQNGISGQLIAGEYLLNITDQAYSPGNGPLLYNTLFQESDGRQLLPATSFLPEVVNSLEVVDNHQLWTLQAHAKPPWAQRIWRNAEGLYVAHESGLVLHLVEASPQQPQAQWQAQDLRQIWPWARQVGVDKYGLWAEFAIGNISHRLRWIVSGDFMMGSPGDEKSRDADETQHQVTLTQGFWLGETTCTQALWQAVMRKKPDDNAGQLPVVNIDWDQSQSFIQKLAKLLPGLTLSLPTEAQWEYACRAGTTSAYWWGEEFDSEYANNSEEVKEEFNYPCNDFGLKSMSGNVDEWCQDYYGAYPKSPVTDPIGPEQARQRVLRGGSWIRKAHYLRSANRLHLRPDYRNDFTGLRLAAGLSPQSGGARQDSVVLGTDRRVRSTEQDRPQNHGGEQGSDPTISP